MIWLWNHIRKTRDVGSFDMKNNTIKFFGVMLALVGIAGFLFIYEGMGNFLSVVSPTMPGLSVSVSSSNPNQGVAFSELSITGISQLAVSHSYNWSLTIHNTGTLAFTPYLTVRIATPNSTSITEPGTSPYLGAQGGIGLIQVCPDGTVNSTTCLVNLISWDFKATTSGEQIGASPQDPYVFSLIPGTALQPGQSVTVYFTTSVPSGTPSGAYHVISNLVANAPSVGNDIVAYNSQTIDVGSVAGTYSLEVIGLLGMIVAGASIVIASALMKRRW